jgi:hypothetical protein
MAYDGQLTLIPNACSLSAVIGLGRSGVVWVSAGSTVQSFSIDSLVAREHHDAAAVAGVFQSRHRGILRRYSDRKHPEANG